MARGQGLVLFVKPFGFPRHLFVIFIASLHWNSHCLSSNFTAVVYILIFSSFYHQHYSPSPSSLPSRYWYHKLLSLQRSVMPRLVTEQKPTREETPKNNENWKYSGHTSRERAVGSVVVANWSSTLIRSHYAVCMCVCLNVRVPCVRPFQGLSLTNEEASKTMTQAIRTMTKTQ